MNRLSTLFPTEETGAVRIADVDGERAFLLPISHAKRVAAVASATGLLACGAAIALGAPRLAALVGGLVIAVVVLALAAVVSGERGLALTPTRVIVIGKVRAELPWGAIREAALRGQVLDIASTDPAQHLVVPANHLAADPLRAHRAVKRYLDDPGRRERIGTPEELLRMI